MDRLPRLIVCHCAHARMVPPEVQTAVLEWLRGSGLEFESVADLCELAARQDPALQCWAREAPLKILACYPRAIQWLFAAAKAPLPDRGVEVLNLRTQNAETILGSLQAFLEPVAASRKSAAEQMSTGQNSQRRSYETPLQEGVAKPGWNAWFPVIDFDRCTQCMQCLSFCLFGVFGLDEHRRIQVQQPQQCKTNCPACSRVCPEAAIIFPKYAAAPINGEAVSAQDLQREKMRIDVSALLGGDLYQVLRQRSERAKSRFSKERDADKALAERRQCMARLVQQAGIPPEVLAALPSPDEIQRKAGEALAKAQAALQARREAK
jgi:NAD-dependent dihydropyrimidine dehydrogenase PreA subunit